MVEIGLGVALFTGLVLCLVLVILLARSRLVPSGEAVVTVNEAKALQARIGDRLLGVLGEADIRLPSACGGVGTCGQCRVRVLDGGGPVQPIERAQITAREVADGTRLACQVTIKPDLSVAVPEEAFGVSQWQCRVRSTRSVATLMKELVLELPAGETIDFRAGSYVLIDCPPHRANFADFDIGEAFRPEWDRLDLWRLQAAHATATTRAYSMANHPGENDVIMLVIRIAIPPPGAPDSVPPGVVSSYLFALQPGDTVSVSGPFGHFFAADTDAEMVFIGGGAGMAPMRSHIFNQLDRRGTRRRISFWYGARSRAELFYEDDFDRLQAAHDNFDWHVALSEPRPEDDWSGAIGFIHDVVRAKYLETHPAPEECEYYLCGPPMMIKAVCSMLDNLGVDPENIVFDDFGG